jgi:ketose-bisphosphate aldolase
MGELLKKAASEGYAVPAFCVWDAETIELVLKTADRVKAPVILMAGPAEFSVLSPAQLSQVASQSMRRHSVPAALHLDHGDSVEVAEACLAAGFTSVMLDYSTRPYEENASAMKQVVKMAHPLGVTVEGELGVIGRADGTSIEGGKTSSLTDPGMARDFVRETGVDALAISIGNAHGAYTRLPNLDFERLAELHSNVPVPLVLHGGSGTPAADLRRAISLGIAKVNVATDLVAKIRGTLMEQWNAGKNLWVPIALGAAIEATAPVVEKWFNNVGASGRA